MKIGILGPGATGDALATQWVTAGHEVMIASRTPEQAIALQFDYAHRAQDMKANDSLERRPVPRRYTSRLHELFEHIVGAVLGLCLLVGPVAHASDPVSPVVHQLSGGETEVHANAYVIEGRESLVLVDTLLTVQGGERVRAKIRELEKPLNAVVLTHGHPDHYGGLAPAIDGLEVPVYTVRGVDDVIRRDDADKGEALAAFGIPWPERRSFPTDIVADGTTLTFQDISLTVHEIGPAESDFDAIWVMDADEGPIVFVGDLLAVDAHVYVADGNTANWIRAVGRLQKLFPKDAVLHPGHGETLTPDDSGWVVGYLQRYREEVSRLAEGGVHLTDAEKEELRRTMIGFVGNDRNARWTEEGADPVAQEMANERWRKK